MSTTDHVLSLGQTISEGEEGNKEHATEVVNCKVCYIRPEYHDLKEWCKDPRNCYIGRKGVVFVSRDGVEKDADDTGQDKKERYPKKDSVFANPFKLKKKKDEEEKQSVQRKEVLTLYEEYIIEKIEKGEGGQAERGCAASRLIVIVHRDPSLSLDSIRESLETLEQLHARKRQGQR